jgi:membrane fusion protein (multidrug efflux system)
VTTADVALRTIPKTLPLTGTLLGNRDSELAADSAGKVVATFVERGDVVRAGSVIARLDSRSAALGRSEAAAQAEAARAQRDNADVECARAEKLFAQQVISRAEYDRTRTSCQTAVHSANAARARQLIAEKAIGDSSVRAPFAGLVAERYVELGEYVTPGKVVATIVEMSPLRLEIAVPEAVAGSVQTDQDVDFSVAAHDSRTFSGKIRYVAPIVRRSSRDVVVEALVDNAESALRPGMFATCLLPIGKQTVTVVPKSAVTGSSSSPRVYVVKEGRIEERVIQLGDAHETSIAVLKGVAPGERVVSAPNAAVQDGVRVK